LVSNDQLQVGDKIDDEFAVWIQCVTKAVTPGCEIGLALDKKVPDKTLKRLRKRGIWDVALVLISLA
jgi:hypothetical protein